MLNSPPARAAEGKASARGAAQRGFGNNQKNDEDVSTQQVASKAGGATSSRRRELLEGYRLDAREIAVGDPTAQAWEYWLQVCLGTGELHAARAWSLGGPAQQTVFHRYAREFFAGPVVGCWVPLQELRPDMPTAQDFADTAHFRFDPDAVQFSFGSVDLKDRSAAKRHAFVLVHVALGRTYSPGINDEEKRLFSTAAAVGSKNRSGVLSGSPITNRLQDDHAGGGLLTQNATPCPPGYDSVCERNTEKSGGALGALGRTIEDEDETILGGYRSKATSARRAAWSRSASPGGSDGGKNVAAADEFGFRYTVQATQQVYPIALLEVEFTGIPVRTPPFICEVCDEELATVYCLNDRAHFCETCDDAHHRQDPLLQKHRRVGIEHSPYQFGMCTIHPRERYEAVCLKTSQLLCSHCILIGSHSSPEMADNPLVSTLDAFKMAMQGLMTNKTAGTASAVSTSSNTNLLINNSDVLAGPGANAAESRKILYERLQIRHDQLTKIHLSYDGIQRRVESVLRQSVQTIHNIQEKKLQYLQSLRRELLAQLLLFEWEWGDAFYAHARMALPPVEFLKATRRHKLLMNQFLALSTQHTKMDAARFPSFLYDDIIIEGNLDVVTTAVGTSATPPGPLSPTPTNRSGRSVSPRSIPPMSERTGADGWQDLPVRDGGGSVSKTAEQYQFSVRQPTTEQERDRSPPTRASPLVQANYLQDEETTSQYYPRDDEQQPALLDTTSPRSRSDLGSARSAFGPIVQAAQRGAATLGGDSSFRNRPSPTGRGTPGFSPDGSVDREEGGPLLTGQSGASSSRHDPDLASASGRAARQRTADRVPVSTAAEVDAAKLVDSLRSAGGRSSQYSDTLQFLRELPARERTGVDIAVLQLLNAREDGSATGFLQAALNDDMKQAQGSVATLFSTRSVLAALTSAMVKLAGSELMALEPDLILLLQRAEGLDGGSGGMFAALSEYLDSILSRPLDLPAPFVILLQRIFQASTEHFDLDPVSVTGAFFLSRILSPTLLRLAQKQQMDSVDALPPSVPELSRQFQKIARFIVSATTSDGLPPSDELQFLKDSADKIVRAADLLLRREAGVNDRASIRIPRLVAEQLPERLVSFLQRYRTQSPAAKRILTAAGVPG
ncbi:unnamed protein product [Amoebophrya sp. A120]|nr:unnamed protein product [Amoebophrya sp. A120]|eukprot:GSA120T00003117001.1